MAFPSIPTNVFGAPAEDAVRVSVEALGEATTRMVTVLLVRPGAETAEHWEQPLRVAG